jgi:predicted ATP-grasp superfamily ATP-dependent carboligase
MEKVIVINATGLGYQVIKALAKHGIHSIVVYDKEEDEIGRYSKYVIDAVKVPHYIEKPELLLDLLLKKAAEWSGTLIIPTKDYGVEFLAQHRDILSQHYLIPTPDQSVIKRIVNKKNLYGTASELGIAVPRIFCPGSLEELVALEGKITFPCLVKPGLGHLFFRKFDFKMIEAATFDDLVRSYRNLTCDFTSDEFELMICEIVPGPDSAQMVQYVSYIDQSGELLASMTSRKIRQDPPRYGQGRIARSERISDLDEQSYRLLREVGYYGFSEIEWKYDPREGIYKLIEINPRFIFYIGLCIACGINFPYIQYADLVRHQKIRVDSFRENVYWIHEYKDVLHTALHHRMENLSLWDYVRPYLGRKSFAIFDPRDPGPFYHQWREHAGNVLKRKLCASK